MAAHNRTESATTATELRYAGRAVTGAASALLRIHLLTGPPDFGAALRLVCPALALRELPVDATLDEVGARLQSEDRIGQRGLARILSIESDDLEFHHSPSFFFFTAAIALSAALAALSAALAACAAAFAASSAALAACATACSAGLSSDFLAGCPLFPSTASVTRHFPGFWASFGRFFFTASRTVTHPLLAPGTAPSTRMRPRSTSVCTTLRLSVVTRSTPR